MSIPQTDKPYFTAMLLGQQFDLDTEYDNILIELPTWDSDKINFSAGGQTAEGVTAEWVSIMLQVDTVSTATSVSFFLSWQNSDKMPCTSVKTFTIPISDAEAPQDGGRILVPLNEISTCLNFGQGKGPNLTAKVNAGTARIASVVLVYSPK